MSEVGWLVAITAFFTMEYHLASAFYGGKQTENKCFIGSLESKHDYSDGKIKVSADKDQ